MPKKIFKTGNRINILALIPLLAMVIFLAVISFLAISGKWIFKTDTTIRESAVIQQNERSETFSISGDEAGYFSEITFNPFQINKEGEQQTITLVLKNSEEIDSATAILRDGTGLQNKDFSFISSKGDLIYYQIVWQPKYLVSGASYPVEFRYQTESGQENKMTLFWKTSF